MFIVLELNQDEFGRGNSRPVHTFDDKEKLMSFLLRYNGDTSRLEIFEGRRVRFKLDLE